MLRARAGSDPLDAQSWVKAKAPVIASSAQRGVWAPGHNAFFRAGGKTWTVYHANPAAGMGCTAKRAPHVREVHWSRDGVPLFGE